MHARAIFDRCTEAGGDEERCSQAARQAYGECVAAHCDAQNEPSECAVDCRAHANAALEECIAAGNDRGACAERALALFNRCLDANCAEEAPERPAPDEAPERPAPEGDACLMECRADGAARIEACIEAGGGREACIERVAPSVRACAEACAG